jgi:hypothetical protein
MGEGFSRYYNLFQTDFLSSKPVSELEHENIMGFLRKKKAGIIRNIHYSITVKMIPGLRPDQE